MKPAASEFRCIRKERDRMRRQGGREGSVCFCLVFGWKSTESSRQRTRISSGDKVEDKGQTEIMGGKRSQPGEKRENQTRLGLNSRKD